MEKAKKALAGLMIVCMMLTSTSYQNVLAENVVSNEAVQIDNEVAAEAVTVTSLTCDSLEIIEKAEGYYQQEYDFTTNSYVEYFYYNNVQPTFSVQFSDGTVYENQRYGVQHNGQYYSLNVLTNQSYSNQWEVGKYSVVATLADATTEFTVEIVESPIISITCEPLQIIEGTNGYYTTGYHPTTGAEIEYYYYNMLYPTFNITFADGTTLNNQSNGVYYNGQYYSFTTVTNQSCTDRWQVGDYTVTGKVMGYEAQFQVTILESPIEKLEIEDVDVIVGTNGYNSTEYIPSTGTYESYFRYNYAVSNAIVYFKDGNIKNINGTWFEYGGNSYTISLSAQQSVENKWDLGKHIVTAKVAGVETQYRMNIIESPYASIEILNVKPVIENQNCEYQEGIVIYNIPDFSYKIHLKDGSSIVGYYSNHNFYEDEEHRYFCSNTGVELSVESDQYSSPWTVGGENYFTVSCPGDLRVEVKVEMQQAEEYEYYEVNGEIHFTGYKKFTEKLEIPSEIGGKPVVALVSLGQAAQTIQELVIPDSVKTIEEDALNYYWESALKNVTIGSGVTYLHADMFSYCSELESITISENNKAYSSIDGVVYDKAGETVVAYPLAKGYEYTLPATAKNIDIMFSELYNEITLVFDHCSDNFIQEDGILYNADKTKVISCSTDKSGEYQMPDSVVEIGDYAFMNCTGLSSVSVAKGVTNIAYSAFMNCTSLKTVELPESLVSIEKAAFYYCLSLEEIKLPNTLKTIEELSFGSSYLKKISIPDSVETIGDYAFAWSKIGSAEIGTGVSIIGKSAFSGTPIQTVTIPDNVIELSEGAFSSCESLTSVLIGKGISLIHKNSFAYCKSLKQVVFENEQVTVEDWAFTCCPIESVNMENVKSFGLYSFSESKIKTLSVSDGVTEIAYGAFMNSSDLGEIDVPESVIKIGGHAFDNTAWSEKQENGSVYLEHIYYTYKGSIPADTVLSMKDGTTVIADTAFEEQQFMSSILLPEGLITIGNAAFFKCVGLTEITIPASVQYIGEFAFALCKNLTAIHVDPDNPYYKSIDGVLFNKDGTELIWCPKQSADSYTVPRSVERIKTGAFGCSGPIRVIIQNRNVTLEYGAIGYSCISYSGMGTPDREFERVESYIECPDNSSALQYAKDNLIGVEINNSLAIQTGDMDGNDTINSDDAVYLLYHTLMPDRYPINQTGDFNGDNMVNSDDAIYLLYHVMLPEQYPLNI